MSNVTPIATPLTAPDLAERVRQIRSRLPGQVLRERVEMARLNYGPLYTLAEIRKNVAETLRWKPGFVRSAELEPIESYRGPIPDEALLKYDDAVKSRLFSEFWVATPTYYAERQVDPWIVGQVEGTDFYAVIACWDV